MGEARQQPAIGPPAGRVLDKQKQHQEPISQGPLSRGRDRSTRDKARGKEVEDWHFLSTFWVSDTWPSICQRMLNGIPTPSPTGLFYRQEN